MDDLESMTRLVAFYTACLHEEEQAAYLLGGTEWTAERLGDHDYEIRVQHDPLLHGTIAAAGGIADVQRQDVAEWIAAHGPRQAQRASQPDHALLAEYATVKAEAVPGQWKGGYVEALEWVIKTRAARWAAHPQYLQEWKP